MQINRKKTLKTIIVFLIISSVTLILNLNKFEIRFALVPLMLLTAPFFIQGNLNYFQCLEPHRKGFTLFIIISFIVILFYPPVFLLYHTMFAGYSFVTPQTEQFLSAALKGVVIIPVTALPEELFFRGFVQEDVLKLRKKKTFPFVTQKNLITSILFALMHAFAFMDISRITTFFPSLLFGLITEKSNGSVLYAILFHGITNITAFTLWTFVSYTG